MCIGCGVMIGVLIMVMVDVIFFGMVYGLCGYLDGLNVVGLCCCGVLCDEIYVLCDMLYRLVEGSFCEIVCDMV